MEDLISRQAVIDACDQSINLFEAVDMIKELPPVNPQPKTVKNCDTCKHDEAFGCPSFIHDRCENYSEWEQKHAESEDKG